MQKEFRLFAIWKPDNRCIGFIQFIRIIREKNFISKAFETLLLSGDKDLIELGITICTGFIDLKKVFIVSKIEGEISPSLKKNLCLVKTAPRQITEISPP